MLGKGAFGEVWEGRSLESGELRAIKIINKDQMSLVQKKKIYEEISFLKSLDHPHIVRVREFFENEKSLQIIMNKVEGKELFT